MKMQNTTLKYSETVVGSPYSAESVTQYTFGMISSTPMRIARHDAPMCGGVVGGVMLHKMSGGVIVMAPHIRDGSSAKNHAQYTAAI